MSRLYMMVTIANRNMKHIWKDFYNENANLITFRTLGKGTANSEILDYFGLEATEKIITFSIVTDEMWRELKRGLIVRMQIDAPGTGIAFLIPLSSIGGKRVLQFLLQDFQYEKEEESVLKETKYELLMVIVNQGCIDTVMDAARSANAGGGTVIHAKGTGMAGAEKFLGVSLAEEKEIIIIVTRTIEKNKIMRAIMDQTGLDSPEKALVFSLPVTSVAGMRIREDEIVDDVL